MALDQLGPVFLLLTAAIALLAGFVKGAVGFAMPMIMISAVGSYLPPELALAALILPTVAANLWQASRGGALAAWNAVISHRLMFVSFLATIAASAQLVGILTDRVLFLVLGVPIVVFTLLQITGFRLTIRAAHRRRAQVIAGLIGGFTGGLSGVWGPPIIMLLTASDTAKAEQVRVQGVIYSAGSVVLLLSHLGSGVLNPQTLPLSLWLTAPAMLGMALGFAVHDRLDQGRFRRATLIVLTISGLNLIRRALTG